RTAISPLSLHDALPICRREHRPPALDRRGEAGPELVDRGGRDRRPDRPPPPPSLGAVRRPAAAGGGRPGPRVPARDHLRRRALRSEEHTSELQSRENLV